MSVTMNGYRPDGSARTLLGASTITANDILKPVVADTSAANTVKLASDGEAMIGIIDQRADYTSQGEGIVLTVAFRFGAELSYTGDLAVGDLVVADGNGGVRKVVTSGGSADTIPAGVTLPRVWEITDSTNKKCVISLI